MRLLTALLLLAATAPAAQTLRLAAVAAPDVVLLSGDASATLDVRVSVENGSDRPQPFRVEVEIENGGLRVWTPEAPLAARASASSVVAFGVPASVLRAEARRTGALSVEVRLIDERRDVVARERIQVSIVRDGTGGGGAPPSDREDVDDAPTPVTVRGVSSPPATTMPVRPATSSAGFAGALLQDATLTNRVVGRGTAIHRVEVVVLVQNHGTAPWAAPFDLALSISRRGSDGLWVGVRGSPQTLHFEPALAPGEIRGIPVVFGTPTRLRVGSAALTPTSPPVEVTGELRLRRGQAVRITARLSSPGDADPSDNAVTLQGRVDDRLRLLLEAPRISRYVPGPVFVTPSPRD